MKPIIEIKKLSKRYEISHQGRSYVAMRDILANTLKHPIAAASYRLNSWAGKIEKEEFWALKNINLSINKGEAVGIIGPNGAGKSTLLKILTRITPPTSGQVRLGGRVSALLEVGTGFHPELTGRENIFLNGAILGMRKNEIERKFDAIVDFSGVEKFLDTPVKHYSTGMYVRLAFSVAAHLEPDILMVDEVLAVGDVAFQKKCLGKMDEVTKSAGRTVLFVSHNMTAIQSLCKKCVLIKEGKIVSFGNTAEVVNQYLTDSKISQDLGERKDRKSSGDIRLTSFFIESRGRKVSYLKTGGDYTFCFGYEISGNKIPKDVNVASAISMEDGSPLVLNWTNYTNQNFHNLPPKGIIRCHINQKFPLADGIYPVSAQIRSDVGEDFIKNAAALEVRPGDFFGTGINTKHSPIFLDQEWSFHD